MIAVDAGTRTTSRVLPAFVCSLKRLTDPVLIDLGSAVNVTYFGERFACRMRVEDLFAEVEAYARGGQPGTIADLLAVRPAGESGTVAGILSWNLFDFLDRKAGRILAARLVEMLAPGGVVYGFFGTRKAQLTTYTRYMIESDSTLRQRSYPATPAWRQVMTTRDINKMFDGLRVTEAILLKNGMRETLFQKP